MKQLKSRSGGLFRLVFVIMLVDLGLILISLFVVGKQTIQESTEKALQERLTLSQVIAARVDDHLNQTLRSVETLIKAEGIAHKLDDPEAVQEFVEKIRLHLGGMAFYTVILDTNRQVIGLSPYIEEVAKKDFTSAACVEFVSVNQKPIITRAIFLGAPTPIVAMVIPILDDDLKLKGTIFTGLNLSDPSFTHLLESTGPGITGYIEVVDSTGLVLGATLKDRLWQKDDHGEQFNKLILEKLSVVGTCHRCHLEGQTVLDRSDDVMAFAPLSAAKWGVALRQLKTEAFAFTTRLEQEFILIGLLAIFTVGFSIWLLSGRIVHPIVELTGTCQEIAAGNLDAPIPLHGPGEIGKLANAFDFMRLQLKVSLEKAQSWGEELEKHISLRTKELVESQDRLVKANQELSVLNTVGDALRQSLDLDATINTALERMLDLTVSEWGCIFLKGPVNHDPVIAALLCRNSEGEGLDLMPWIRPDVLTIFEQERTDPFKVPVKPISANGNGNQEGEYYLTTYIPLVGNESLPGVMVLAKKNDCGISNHERELYQSIGAQIGISIEDGLLYKELVQKEESLNQLLHKLIVAQEEERRRIARELHDETSQSLTALGVGLKTVMMAPASSPDEVKKRLAPLEVMASGMVDEIGRMIQDLRPSLLDDLGLLSAIDWYADVRLGSIGIQVTWKMLGVERRLPTELETTLFRLAQEATNNIVKHAQAERVNILLEFDSYHVILEIEDDGHGFDVKKVLAGERSASTHGLLGMRERVDLFGGSLSITSQIGSGTHIRVEIPTDMPVKMRA